MELKKRNWRFSMSQWIVMLGCLVYTVISVFIYGLFKLGVLIWENL